MAKHFPGGGAQGNSGEDSHFEYGKDQVYPGGMLEYHMRPLRRAIKAGVRQMMPYYSRPVGTEYEEVGFAFKKGILEGLLKKELGFEGIVITDWGVVNDANIMGQFMPARAWGAESLDELGRVMKAIEAGCDQFGGDWKVELIVEAVEKGLITEQKLDESCLKLLEEKFELGLFDEKRFVDVEQAEHVVGRSDFCEAGLDAQWRSCTLLVNKDNMLPPTPDKSAKKFYIEGLDPAISRPRGLQLVDNPGDAEIAILRLRTPFDQREGGFERMFHAGSLEFTQSELDHHNEIFKPVPAVIVDIYLDRPAVITHLAEQAAALYVNFGIGQDCVLDVLLGKAAKDNSRVSPEGKLPFDLPRSMDAVKASACDKPFDTKNPISNFGDGLTYE